MPKQKYTPELALNQLRRCGIRTGDQVIYVPHAAPPGLRALGAIDYLVKHAGFHVERT